MRQNTVCLSFSSAHPMSYLLMFLFGLFIHSSPSTALNITHTLGRYPNFSSFNARLSKTTHLATSINGDGGNGITVLAVDNRDMSKFPAESTSEEVEGLLSLHLVRGYYSSRQLLQLANTNVSLLTFSKDCRLKVKALRRGGFGFTVPGGGLNAEFVKPVFYHPEGRVSIVQVGGLISRNDNGIGNALREDCVTVYCASERSKKAKSLPIRPVFNHSEPMRIWSEGGGFASGEIDLGGLVVRQITSFTKLWETHSGGPDDLGAAFYEPLDIPEGYFMLGTYAEPLKGPFYGGILVGSDRTYNRESLTMAKPTDYTLAWCSGGHRNIDKYEDLYVWLPVAPRGYKAVGYVITTSPFKPSTDKVRCVRSDFTDQCEIDSWIWGDGDGTNFLTSAPITRGIKDQTVSIGAFFAQTNGLDSAVLSCLKNKKFDMSSMPSQQQIETLVKAYAPLVYFHPDEEFLPSSVDWFFANGALLYKKGEEATPSSIEPTGSNLPQGGSDYGDYWLDLPWDEAANERVKKGNLQSSRAYVHVKPMNGGTFTDIVMWIFFPFNGAARARVKSFDVNLGRIGQHVGDWEHLTLRINNVDAQLSSIYFSQHNAGIWVRARELEYDYSTNKFVAYSSLHGHAMNFRKGTILQGWDEIGLRNDYDRSDKFMDPGKNFLVVGAEHLGSTIVKPPWLNYFRKWGPVVDYDIAQELQKASDQLPENLRDDFTKVIETLPYEILKAEGSTGPKTKGSWIGDEV